MVCLELVLSRYRWVRGEEREKSVESVETVRGEERDVKISIAS